MWARDIYVLCEQRIECETSVSSPICLVRAGNVLVLSSLTVAERAQNLLHEWIKLTPWKYYKINVREPGDGLALEPLSDHDSGHQQRRPSVRPGQGNGVAVVVWPMASKGWHREPEHGRRRPPTGVTTPEQQRQYGKKRPRRDTVTRCGDTSTTSVWQLLRRTRLLSTRRRHASTAVRQLVRHTPTNTYDSTAIHRRTAVCQLVQLSNFNVSHTPLDSTLRQFRRRLLLWLLSFTTEQLSYSSSVPNTLCLGY